MQIVAYGAQNIYLTGNPQITFFKVVYRRHTNFAIESIEQTFNGNPNFGSKVQTTISRNGDLINHVYLQVQVPALDGNSLIGAGIEAAWTNSFGHALIRTVEIQIGGQRIDQHYGTWLEIWDELTQTSEKRDGYNAMVGKYAGGSTGLAGNAASSRVYYVPLQFWFCRNPGLSLPLIALQYHEVKINIEFRSAAELIVGLDVNGDRDAGSNTTSISDSAVAMQSAALWVDYIFLDNEERQKMAQMPHEYLIDQLQFTGAESLSFDQVANKVRMNFNHPCKELVWVLQHSDNFTVGTAYNDWFNFSASAPGKAGATYVDLLANAKILLNGHDRFSVRPQSYFRLVQPYQHHTAIPSRHIYVYSFGIRPEEHQPSGTLNMSRIDNAQLVFDLTNPASLPTADGYTWTSVTGQLQVYATNYNVLRIMSGMGGLAYSS